MIDKKKVWQVLQYALFVAGRSDDRFDRELGPIHLIKYVYLVDLDYAKFNNGQTFTGVDWVFHHFGPWSVDVFQQLDDALAEVGAKKNHLYKRL